MKFTTLLASSAALAAIAIVLPATSSSSWSPVATAQAATSISFSLFYDGLDDHGDWVSHNGDYVFVPVIADRDWQPYTEGHWIYARGYGWTWVSDEPFGWATYHYGRWGFEEEIGWYWVPGKRWAPAWVSWRRSGNHVAWAPLAPHRGGDDDISITVNVDSIPDYYWVVVPSRSFLEINLNVVIIDDDRERRRIVNDTEFVGSVQVENNIIVNNVIDINFVEKNTDKKVMEVEVTQTDDPAKAKASDGEIAVFSGTVEADKAAKPPKLKDVSAVKENQAETKKKIKAESDEPAAVKPEDQAAQPGEENPDEKKLKAEQTEGEAADTENVEQAVKPADGKKKLKAEQTEGEATETENVEQAVKPADGKKKLKAEQAEGDAVETGSVEQAVKPADGKKKLKAEQTEGEAADPAAKPEQKKAAKKKVVPEEAEAAAVSDKKKTAAGEEPAAKKDKKAVPCDPAADPATQEGCVPQQ